MTESSWVVEVNEKVLNLPDTSVEEVHWKRRSIYNLPACVTDLNKKAFSPQAVSFGPYHHGEPNLKPMEEHKLRALLHFLKRSNKCIDQFLESLSEVAEEIKDSYDQLGKCWKNDTLAFLQLMIVDGCFMLEIMRVATGMLDDYAPNDPVFSSHGRLHMMPYIRRDMMMLENQLPMLVLDRLVAVESNNSKDADGINKLILDFLPNTNYFNLGKCVHVLDAFRKSLLWEDPTKKKKYRKHRHHKYHVGDDIIRSATELNEAGITFKTSKTTSLKDITFHNGVLRLPVVVVDDSSEPTFLNLIAFERFHVGIGNEVTSYVFFMDNIIDSQKDVALLHARGIIQNAIGSDKAVAKLFNSLSKDMTLDPDSSLDVVHKMVNAYSRKPWNEWRANLIHTYFRNPWAILSVLAAVFLFALTIAQTVYTIIQYYQSKN